MDIDIFQPTVLCAAFGGLAIQIIGLMELQKVPKVERPDFRDFVYWIPFICAPILGGALVYIYVLSEINLKPIVSLNVGISAPLLYKAMAQANPFTSKTIDPGKGA
jgi:hypothetical protein